MLKYCSSINSCYPLWESTCIKFDVSFFNHDSFSLYYLSPNQCQSSCVPALLSCIAFLVISNFRCKSSLMFYSYCISRFKLASWSKKWQQPERFIILCQEFRYGNYVHTNTRKFTGKIFSIAREKISFHLLFIAFL